MKTTGDNFVKKSELAEEIQQLKTEKNCLILAHNYQLMEVQNIADIVGDSLELAQAAAESRSSMVLLCGIRIMAESVKLLNPEKKVLLSHPDARCPLAEMKKLEELLALKSVNPNAEVVCYVNATIDLRAESTITCTSGNACKVIKALPATRKIIFVPDKNLGSWAAYRTGRSLIMWEGYCDVHDQISLSEVMEQRRKYPQHLLAVHPECSLEVCREADYVCSTSQMITFAARHQRIIIGTETGLLEQLRYKYPSKDIVGLSARMICENMKKTTLETVHETLSGDCNEIDIPPEIRIRATRSLQRMFELIK